MSIFDTQLARLSHDDGAAIWPPILWQERHAADANQLDLACAVSAILSSTDVRDEYDSRVDPRDNDQPLDNVAPVKALARHATVDAVCQCSQGAGTDDEQDESDGDADKVGEKAKDDRSAEDLEADGEDYCTCQLGLFAGGPSDIVRPIADPHILYEACGTPAH